MEKKKRRTREQIVNEDFRRSYNKLMRAIALVNTFITYASKPPSPKEREMGIKGGVSLFKPEEPANFRRDMRWAQGVLAKLSAAKWASKKKGS